MPAGRWGVRAPLLVVALALVASAAWADRRGDAKAQVAFGIEVARAGLWREAVFRFERAIEIDPTYAAAYNNLAVAYEQAGELDKARRAYEKALELAPKSTFIRQNYEMFKELHDRPAPRRPP
jgi:Flp pilus assembly protein TadD